MLFELCCNKIIFFNCVFIILLSVRNTNIVSYYLGDKMILNIQVRT